MSNELALPKTLVLSSARLWRDRNGRCFGELNERIAQIERHDILERLLSDDVKFKGI